MQDEKERPDGSRGGRETNKYWNLNHSATHGQKQPGYYGGCPECHGNDGFLNVNRDHYFVCHEHGVYWPIGRSLFHGHMLEDERDWQRNAAVIARYRKVSPVRRAA